MATSYIYPPTPAQRHYGSKDLNTLGETGMFVVDYPSNDPVQGASGYVFVINAGPNSYMQMFFEDMNGRIYFRQRYGSTWTDWEKLMSEHSTELFYKSGSTFTSTGENTASRRPLLSGIASADAKTLYFNVVVDKAMDNISTVAVTELTGTLFSISGAVGSSTDWTANTYSLDAHKTSERTVRIALTKADSSAFSVTGGTPIAMSAYVKLTFGTT